MNEQLVRAYEEVINDLESDIGYEAGALETALSVLRGRLNELTTVWAIPNEIWETEFSQPILCDSCNGSGEDRAEQTCHRCGGSGLESL